MGQLGWSLWPYWAQDLGFAYLVDPPASHAGPMLYSHPLSTRLVDHGALLALLSATVAGTPEEQGKPLCQFALLSLLPLPPGQLFS